MPASKPTRFHTVWQDLTFEGAFLHPLYSLVSNTPALLVACHEKLARFQIPMSEFTANSAASLAQVGIHVRAFNGRGDINVNLENYTATFSALQSARDSEIVLDFVGVVEGCLTALPNFPRLKSRTIRAAGHVALEEPNSANRLLSSFIARDSQIKPKKLGANDVDHIFGFNLHSKEGGWDARLTLERSVIDLSHLFYSGTITFDELEERSDTLESRYRTAEQLLATAFHECGLEPNLAES